MTKNDIKKNIRTNENFFMVPPIQKNQEKTVRIQFTLILQYQMN